jgi:hypothetical protein
MDRTGLPPRPHLFGDERKDRCEQPQQRRERELQRRAADCCPPASSVAVSTSGLDELDVVVAEAPEESLGAFERAGVVVRIERGGAFGDDASELGEHGLDRGDAVTNGGSAAARAGGAEHELRRVEHLDRETAPDLHLPFVECSVGAGATRARPVAHSRRSRIARGGASA